MKCLVIGATGNQGGATARCLLEKGASVRALTRKPDGEQARALAALGAEVVRGDMNDVPSLDAALRGMDGVFSVQNFWERGNDEVKQGKAVADAAVRAGVGHIVFASVARADDHPGLAHFETKNVVEKYLATLPIRSTILRPVYFMDNLVNPKFSGVSWAAIRDVLGETSRLQMIAAADIGAFAAQALLDPDRSGGRTITLAGDDVTFAQALEAHRRVFGRDPKYSPVLKWLMFRAMKEGRKMFEWYREPVFDADIAALRQARPELLTLEAFFRSHAEAT